MDVNSAPGGCPERFATDNPVMLILAYLWGFSIIPLLTEANDRVVRWHAVTGLVLLIAEVVGGLCFVLAGMILGIVLPTTIVSGFLTIGPVLLIGVVVLHGILTVDALGGRRWRLPVVTRYVTRIVKSESAPEEGGEGT